MDFNVQQEARVWSRVMGGRDGSLGAEQILALIREEEQAACTYRHLSRLICPQERRTLLRIAADEACHADRLRAVYFLMEGKRICPEHHTPPCVTCLTETLRQRYRDELADAKQYESLTAQAGEFACTMDALAKDEKKHSRMLLCLLQRIL